MKLMYMHVDITLKKYWKTRGNQLQYSNHGNREKNILMLFKIFSRFYPFYYVLKVQERDQIFYFPECSGPMFDHESILKNVSKYVQL